MPSALQTRLLTREGMPAPRTGWQGWLFRGDRLDRELPASGKRGTHPWYMVLWLTGVDYFSTLGYQPGIALLAAGAIAPLATGILVAVTLVCALPVYALVARRSHAGQGSIALLEHLLPGWWGKVFVLVLLGFAATDFVITMTLSAADAAQHAIENPLLHDSLGEARIPVTLGLLALLAVVFLKGFKEAIGLAAAVGIPYLLLNAVVLGRGLYEVLTHPELLPNWKAGLAAQGDTSALLVAAALVFPRLALGLSGFETGVSVMPLIRDDAPDSRAERPEGRIRNTRKLLAAAALIMSAYLVFSSFVTTVLIPTEAYQIGGPASGRAIAWLAHGLLGPVFGTLYDISTILILWFAGASAMAGLLHIVPRYLPRFGMAPRWVAYTRPLVLMLFAVDVVVTLAFRASVEAQGGAYATGVLVLMLSAAIAAALGLWRESRLVSLYCWLIGLVFAYTLAENVNDRPDGVIIASIFILIIVSLSAVSRLWRSTELRFAQLEFADEASEKLWQRITGRKVHLVPAATNSPEGRARKEAEIRKHYAVSGPLAFLHVSLLDNRSEFLSSPQVRAREENGHVVIEVARSVAIANTVAVISELIDPRGIFLGLSRKNLMSQAMRYLIFGEGETGLLVYTILIRYWGWTPEEDVRPLIFLMSD